MTALKAKPVPVLLTSQDQSLIAEFFDHGYYSKVYPDVPTDRENALDHFLTQGMWENRNPNAFFQAKLYADRYEMAGENHNPTYHYVKHGRKEQRKVPTIYPRDSLQLVLAEFDFAHYRAEYSEIIGAADDALLHFATEGWRQLFNPAPWFSTLEYLATNPGIVDRGLDPFEHYIRYGRSEKRKIARPTGREFIILKKQIRQIEGYFQPEYYTQKYPSVDFSKLKPAHHFLIAGWRRGWDPNANFSTTAYLASYPDVRNAGVNPLIHYLEAGRSEGRQPNHCVRDAIADEFDATYYLSQKPSLGGLSALEHFVAFGCREGLDPNPSFSSTHYARLNPDVLAAGINLFYHYLTSGRGEGRTGKASPKRRIDPSNKLEPILFVGHDGIRAGAEVVLLEIVKWYAENTRRPLAVLLLRGGLLASSYADYAETFVVGDNKEDVAAQPGLEEFLSRPYAAAYVNTVASGAFCPFYDKFLAPRNVPLILHVHELEKVIRVFQDSFDGLRARATSIIAVSKAVRDCLVDVFACSTAQIFLSNAFIRPVAKSMREVAIYRKRARDTLNLGETDFVIAGCGTAYQRKGSDLFLETAIRVVSRELIPGAHFVWIGSGPQLEAHRTAVNAASLQERIHFIGFREDANELLAAADVFFLASREDPFPLVCLEAAQFAAPTLYFDGMTGISEFTGSTAGLGTLPFDIDKCCAALRGLARNRTRLEQLGAEARSRLMAGYTAELRMKEIAQHVRLAANLAPEVSVIVPAFNHSLYIAERIESILSQSLQDFEIVILDDCSDDDTVAIAERFCSDSRVRLIQNAANSGSPFKQWKLGLEMASSPICWIAEGDDSCSTNFLEMLLPAFDDEQTSIAFCATKIMDEQGIVNDDALNGYYSQSSFPFKAERVKLDGFAAVECGFGAACLIVNASSTLIKRGAILDILDRASTFKMCGDWLVYLHALKSGKLFYTNQATNFFRRHVESAVHKFEGTPRYFEERFQISKFVTETFNLSKAAFRLLLALNENEWHRFRYRNGGLEKNNYLRPAELSATRRNRWVAEPLRIGFYVHGMLFSKGGIERVAASLANHLTRRGHSVAIFCRDWGSCRPVYDLNESVQVIPCFNENDLDSSIQRLRLSVATQNVDIFVPMLSEWLFEPVIEAVRCLEIPIVASEHNDPWKIEELWWTREKRHRCFELVDAVHLLLQTFRPSLSQELDSKVRVIPNGLTLDCEALASPLAPRPRRFIGVGRLEPQKRFDRLIKAFTSIASLIPEWRLDIFGEGAELPRLEALIASSGLADRVALKGRTETIMREFVQSSIFVHPAAFEGFGLVVVEARMAGLPTVAYLDCNGPNELIQHGVNGLLVSSDEDGTSLSEAMMILANNEDLRMLLAENARQGVEAFGWESIVNVWEEFLDSVARHQVLRSRRSDTVSSSLKDLADRAS
jgi:glycosyltransferase involved in cell wall biosynthesis/GT2 family glycosyltransferase